MKNQTSEEDGRNDNGEKKKKYGPNLAMMKKNSNKKRLGGGGLSLEAFANAKTKSGYNPAVIKKQREFYKNAKCVNKYRKSQKQEHNVQQTEQNRQRSRFSLDTTKPPQATGGCEIEISMTERFQLLLQEGNQTGEGKKIHKKNNNNSLQSIREAYEKKCEEEKKAKMEKEALLQAKKEQREMSETLRKERREQMFKKTRSGQPVMKFRIEQILKTLQGSTK